jgi:cytochrome c
VTAYLLRLNNIVPDGTVLAGTTLPQVRMPNRDGFINAYAPGR